MAIIHTILGLLACQLAGEALARLLHLPVPGPVFGMALLLAILLWQGRLPKTLKRTAGGLLSHLSLLFVPGGVGIMVYAARIQAEALPLAAAVLISTPLTIIVTGLVFQALHRRKTPPPSLQEEAKP